MKQILSLFLGFCLTGSLSAQESPDKPGIQHKELPHDWDDDWMSGGGGGNTSPAACVTSSCPPLNEKGKPVTNCWYQKNVKTGFRCLIFCQYSDGSRWGGDGGGNCG